MNLYNLDLSQLPSPCYVINCDILKNNLRLMKKHCEYAGIKPLIAIKGFPLALIYSDISQYLEGASASSSYEVNIAQYIGKEIHVHAPAYRPDEIVDICSKCDHIVFNSISQWNRYKNSLNRKEKRISPGLRINPEYSEINTDMYNPCMPFSRFGVTKERIIRHDISGIEGFHFHALYDQGAETLIKIIDKVLNDFGRYFNNISWLNLGGGHQLADENYNIELLEKTVTRLKSEFGFEIYVEPCENIVTNCGYLVSTVLDIIDNKKQTAILDTSAICHMPGVLEMPYTPDIIFPAVSENGLHKYILAGNSCLAGDVIGEYSFSDPLQIGNKIVFSDMGAYTFSQECYFNGINIPAIVLYEQEKGFRIVKQFDYSRYESLYY